MKAILLAAAFVACATAASAQDRRPDYGPDVNAAGAKKIAAEVVAECQKNSWNVAVAVVDNHGFLVYFERMPAGASSSLPTPIVPATLTLENYRTLFGNIGMPNPKVHGYLDGAGTVEEALGKKAG